MPGRCEAVARDEGRGATLRPRTRGDSAMSGSNKPTAGFAVWAGKAAGNLFAIGLLVAWFAAVNTALDNVNEGLGWVVDRAIHWVTPTPAKGAEYAAPSEGEFFARLMQPDQPKTSCC